MSWQLVSFAILAGVLLAGFGWYERSRPPAQVVALIVELPGDPLECPQIRHGVHALTLGHPARAHIGNQTSVDRTGAVHRACRSVVSRCARG